jgi:phosphatidylinositol glycan class W
LYTSGLCAPKIRDDESIAKRYSIVKEFLKALSKSLLVVLMGLVRVVVHAMVGYHEHLTEYGMHWNFYITISVVNLSLAFLKNVKHALGAALIIMTCYEYILNTTGLKEFILYAPREGLIAANKEGICSSVGYISI